MVERGNKTGLRTVIVNQLYVSFQANSSPKASENRHIRPAKAVDRLLFVAHKKHAIVFQLFRLSYAFFGSVRFFCEKIDQVALERVVILEFVDHDHGKRIFISLANVGMIFQGVHREAGYVIEAQKTCLSFFRVKLILEFFYKFEYSGAEAEVKRVIGNGLQFVVKAVAVCSLEQLEIFD